MKDLLSWLKGKDEASQKRLNGLKFSVENEFICWYPCSGEDFKDIIDFSTNQNIDFKPNLFIHNDYSIDLSWFEVKKNVYEDYELIISNVSHLCLENDFYYTYNNNNPDNEFEWVSNYLTLPIPEERFRSEAYNPNSIGNIFLLDIEIHKDTGEIIFAPVLYFIWETFTLFNRIFREIKPNITHLYKIREGIGAGAGGNSFSVINIFPFLSRFGCKFLISDSQGEINEAFIDELNDLWHENEQKIGTDIHYVCDLGERSNLNAFLFKLEKVNQFKYKYNF